MAVPDQNPFNVYTANGVTTVFPYEFYLINADDLTVSLDGEAVSTGFTVTGIGNVNGGEVTFLTPPANDVIVMLERVVAPVRLTEYQDNGDLLADTVNLDFDRLWMAIKQVFVSLGVALLRPVFGGPFNAKGYRIANLADPVNDQDAATKKWTQSQDYALHAKTLRVSDSDIPALPNAAQRANKIPAFDGSGNPTVMVPDSGSAADVLLQLAAPTGATITGTESGKNVQEELDDSVKASAYEAGSGVASNRTVRRGSGATAALFPLLAGKLNGYRYGVSGYQSEFTVYGYGSSVGNGATLPDPTTQAPVMKFFELLMQSINLGGIYPFSVKNHSVDGSTVAAWQTAWNTSISGGIYPDLAVLCYGMNDFQPSQFNANQTFGPNGFHQRMKTFVDTIKRNGGDVILVTTPHLNTSDVVYSLPSSVNMLWPTSATAPVAPESMIPPASASKTTISWKGVDIEVDVRFLRGNDAIRKIAVETGCVLIDVEKYWFDAVSEHGNAQLFNSGQIVHPNLLGHQLSYWAAFEDFCNNLKDNGWCAPDSRSFNSLKIGGTAVYQNPDAGDLSVQASGNKDYTEISYDAVGRRLRSISKDGVIEECQYSHATAAIYVSGVRTKFYGGRVYATGETLSVSIANNASAKVLVEAYTAGMSSGAQVSEFLISNRNGTLTYTLIGANDTSSAGLMAFSKVNNTITPASAAFVITSLLPNNGIKVRVEEIF